jgi:hypothetical protein
VAVESIELSSAEPAGDGRQTGRVRLLAGLIAALLLVNVIVLAVGLPGSLSAKPVSVTLAATRTLDARTARIHTEVRQRASGAGRSVSTSTSTDGLIDFAQRRTSLRTPLKGIGGAVLIRSLGTVIYMEYPAEARAALHSPTPWVSVDLSPAAGGGGDVPIAIPGGRDLASTLRDLQAGSLGTITNFRTVGAERVRGVSTTRVEATLDKAAILKQIQSLTGLGVSLGNADIREATEDLWVSDDGLIRRTRAHSRVVFNGRTAVSDQTTEYYDFGVSTGSIVAPPADQVTRYSSLMNLVQGIPG